MPEPELLWRCRDRALRLGRRSAIMGVLNVTPDSFSDGGRFLDPDAAIARAREMLREGAEILDIGGESTRPGSDPVDEAEECRRVLPVIRALAGEGALLSIDTMKSGVAEAALEAGVHIVNDVSGGTHDPRMPAVVRDAAAGMVVMHMRGRPKTMQDDPVYEDVLSEVCDYLQGRVARLVEAGLPRECLVLDPGIGFGKRLEDNLALLRGIPSLTALGRPLLIGLSRKRMLGELVDRPPAERGAASLAGLVHAILQGAHIIRVHEVLDSCDAARVADILKNTNGIRTT